MSNRFFFADVGTTSTLTDTLKNTITSSQTDIELNDASNFQTKGEIKIDDELIKYTGRTNNILNGCLRNNNPVSHNSDVNVVLQARNGDSALATDNFYSGSIFYTLIVIGLDAEYPNQNLNGFNLSNTNLENENVIIPVNDPKDQKIT